MTSIWQTPFMKRYGLIIRDRIQSLRNDIDDLRRSVSLILDADNYREDSVTTAVSVKMLRERLAELERELKKAENVYYVAAEDVEEYLSKFVLVPRDNPLVANVTDKMELDWLNSTK